MSKVINHFKTVSTHRKTVRELMFKLGPAFYLQAWKHDLSKYSLAEFVPSVKYWTGKFSPTVNERKEKGYSSAWLHHKGRNKHHYEYWTDYSDQGLIAVRMPPKYFCEMICDRIAASKTYRKDKYTPVDPYEYFLNNMKPDDFINETIRESLRNVLRYMAYNGEDKTFKILRIYYETYHKYPELFYKAITEEKSEFKV